MTRMLFTVCRRDCASILVAGILAIHFLAGTGCSRRQEDIGTLRDGFIEPPVEARPRALWDWVDGNFDLEEITQEMEEAARMGMGGFDIWDVCSVVDEDSIVPAGPAFMSDPSVEAICHAINEAERLGLDLGLIIASGWNAGGAWTLPEHQTMGLFHTDTLVRGPGPVELGLEFPVLPDRTGTGRQSAAIIPRGTDGLPLFYKEVALVAHRLEMKDTSMVITGEMVDLSDFRNPSGLLAWDVPPGSWKVTRYVCTPTGQPLFSHTPNSRGPMIDHFSAAAAERHINYFIEKIESKLGKPIGESGLTYFYTDSYEVRGQLWTPGMSDEFEKRMGYSMIPYLPVLEGLGMANGETALRFLYDFRKLLSDLIIENHYTRIREICEEHGVGFVAEAAGPGWPIHNCPFESLKSSGSLTFPRGEFWHLPSNTDFWNRMRQDGRGEHYLDDLQVIKGVASAAHIYDKKYVEAEAFTGTHLWNEGPGDLKPTADRAFCEGLNRINFHTWPHTPASAGTPGWVYAFGTLVNEHRIWWPMARPWLDYLARCSFMLQQGNFAGDVLFYYGDSVPNFVPAKHMIPGLGPGYDYDVTNTEILTGMIGVEDGRLVLPHGQTYALLVLPDEDYMQPEVLEKIGELVRNGATVVGPRPLRSHGLHGRETRDARVRELGGQIWGDCDGVNVLSRSYGSGTIHNGKELHRVLEELGTGPDFDFRGYVGPAALDFIHRETKDAGIYFIRNTGMEPVTGTALFRQQGRMVEFWDPATGKMFTGVGSVEMNGYTEVPLTLEPLGSVFAVFMDEKGQVPRADRVTGGSSYQVPFARRVTGTVELEGPWKVSFPESQAGAGTVVFDSLVYWNMRPEDGIRFFSGIATYEKSFRWDREIQTEPVFLELEKVVEVAEVSLNGNTPEILWFPPFRMDITGMLKEGENHLEIRVANTWANALAGDARLPAEQRRTRTNVTRLPNAWSFPMEQIPGPEYGLLDGGLAGSVKIHILTPGN